MADKTKNALWGILAIVVLIIQIYQFIASPTEARVAKVETAQKELTTTVVGDGNRITSLESKYDNIEKGISRIETKLDKHMEKQ